MTIMKKFILGIIAIMFLAGISGCTALLVGAGTIGVGMDTMRLERYTTFDTAWDAALETLHNLSADINVEDKKNGQIKAVMADYKIKVHVAQSEQKSVFVDVSVRQKGLPSLKLADQIIEQINTRIRKGN